jgi:predicted enzyme related to lactoylglutathione lyase
VGTTEPHQFKAESVAQIGILVKDDPEELCKLWEKMFGIGPWRTHEIKYKNKEGETVKLFKLAFANLGGVEIEFAQPLAEGLYHKKYVDEHGNTGLHHICFNVDDVDAELENFVAQGAEVLAHSAGSFAYFKTGGPDEVIFELVPRRK